MVIIALNHILAYKMYKTKQFSFIIIFHYFKRIHSYYSRSFNLYFMDASRPIVRPTDRMIFYIISNILHSAHFVYFVLYIFAHSTCDVHQQEESHRIVQY